MMIGTKLKKALLNPWLYASSGIVLYIMLKAAWIYIMEPGTASIDVLSFIINPMAFSGLTPFAAFFCVIPFSSSFCDEYQCGFIRMVLLRSGRHRFAAGTIVSVALSGALALILPFGIVCLTALLKAAPTTMANISDFYYYSIWADIFARYGTGAVLGLKVMIAGLFGAVWATLGLLVSCLCMNRFVTIVVPFVLYQTLWSALMDTPFSPVIYLRADSPSIPSLGYVLWVQGSLFALLAGLSYAGIVWRCRDV